MATQQTIINRRDIAERLAAYLNGDLPLSGLVDWACSQLAVASIDDDDPRSLSDLLARLGLADKPDFALRWEDCRDALRRLGYEIQVALKTAS